MQREGKFNITKLVFLSIFIGIIVFGSLKIAKATLMYESRNFDNWEVVVGDAVYTSPEEPSVDANDIVTIHFSNYSELQANILNRRIMAHNITFKKIIDDKAFHFKHKAHYSFRLTYLPSENNIDRNGQTIEGGLFIWDGSNTKKDYGLAFQWVINPWDANFGEVNIWTEEKWKPIGFLQPDPNTWHTVMFELDKQNEKATLKIDNNVYPNAFTKILKPGWGNEISARLQAEIVSLYPPDTGTVPLHIAQFKDWSWAWEQYPENDLAPGLDNGCFISSSGYSSLNATHCLFKGFVMGYGAIIMALIAFLKLDILKYLIMKISK